MISYFHLLFYLLLFSDNDVNNEGDEGEGCEGDVDDFEGVEGDVDYVEGDVDYVEGEGCIVGIEQSILVIIGFTTLYL